MSDIIDQPPPQPRPDLIPVWAEVISDVTAKSKTLVGAALETCRDVLDDMIARDAIGRERYGMPLTTHNGRSHIIDMYQEMLDAVVYMKAAMLEGMKIPPTMYARLLEDIAFVRRMLNDRSKTKE